MAKIEAENVKAARHTPAIAGRLNRVRSSMGSFWSHSADRNTTIRTAEPTSSPTMVRLCHPLAFPWTSA